MTTATAIYPARIHPHQHVDNGLYPSAQFYATATAALNHLVAFRRKPLFRMLVPPGAASPTDTWNGYFRTGYGCTRVAICVLAAEDTTTTATDPYVSVVLTEVGGLALTAQDFHYGVSAVAGVDDPDSLSPMIRFLDVDAVTEYTLAATFHDGMRVLEIAVYECEQRTVDDANAFFTTFTPSAGSPIFDNRIGQQLQAVSGLLRHNSGLRVDWMRDSGAARTRTSTTPISLIDDTTTGTPSSSSPGFTFNTTARNTAGATTVPVKCCVYARCTSGAGVVVFRDTSGADAVTVNVTLGLQWYTATGALPVGDAVKVDPMYYSDGTHSLEVYAVSLFEDDAAPAAPLSLLLTAHGLSTGDGPFTLTTTGVLPTGLATATDYYAIVVDTDHLLLAASRADALASTEIVLTDAGTGTHTLVTGAAYNATALTFSGEVTFDDANDWVITVDDTSFPNEFHDGDGPFQFTTTGTIAGGLATATDYWLHQGGDPSTYYIAASLADAFAAPLIGVTIIDIADAGTGTHTMTAQPGALHYTPVALGDSTFTVE